IALDDTVAEVEGGETVSGTASSFVVSATSNDTVTTTAKAGAQGSTSVGGGIAIAYIEDNTFARIGSGSGGTITLTGGELGGEARRRRPPAPSIRRRTARRRAAAWAWASRWRSTSALTTPSLSSRATSRVPGPSTSPPARR